MTMSTQAVEMSDSLVLVQAQPIEKLFDRATIDPILEEIKKQCRAVPVDISTDAGRKACASLAFRIAKTKTFIEGQRITLVASEKKRLAAIDSEGKRIREELDALKEEVRRPLTEWEEAEEQRIKKHEALILELGRVGDLGIVTAADIEKRIAYLESVDLSGLAEFTLRARTAKDEALGFFRRRLLQVKKEEEDRVEFARLRQEEEARAQKARDEAIAAKARADAESRAKEAENRAAKAEAEALAAKARAKADAEAAERKAKIAQERAVQQERERADRQRQAEVDAEAKREANKRHRTKINNQAIDALIEEGIDKTVAKAVIELIAKDEIPNVRISY
jgi:hypothetical protein